MNLQYVSLDGFKVIDNPTVEQFKELLDQLHPDRLPELFVSTPDWKLTVAVDTNNERINIRYYETNSNSSYAEIHSLVDENFKEDNKQILSFRRANGEDYALLYRQTVPRNLAFTTALYIFTYSAIPTNLIWERLIS